MSILSISTDEMNAKLAIIVQALLGMISSNFRRVSFRWDGHAWHVWFVLEKEDEQDREEISDFITELDAINGHTTVININIEVTEHPLLFPVFPERVVFLRREYA